MVPGRCVPRIEGDRALFAREGHPDKLSRNPGLGKRNCAAAVRHNLFGGVLPRRQGSFAHHAAHGARLSGLRNNNRRSRTGQRNNFSLMWMLFLIVAALAGCDRHQPGSPDRAYQIALLEFERGNLPTAFAEADGGYRQYSSSDEEWA